MPRDSSRTVLLLTVAITACQSTGVPPGSRQTSQAVAATPQPPAVHDGPIPSAPAEGSFGPALPAKAIGQLGPGSGVLLIDLAPPNGAELTVDAPLYAKASGGIGLHFPKLLKGKLKDYPLPLALPVVVEDGAVGPIEVQLSYYWCTDGNSAACRRERVALQVDLDLTGDAAGGEAHFHYLPSRSGEAGAE